MLTRARARDFAPLPEHVTFTVDLEDHLRAPAGSEPRYAATTPRLLDFLAERGLLATFFVVGDVAARTPALVRRIAAGGHEIASHAHEHVPLAAADSARLGAQLRASRRRLEDLAGRPVLGFRAPLFSLTPATAWAVGALREAGFAYSSSVVPGRGLGPAGWPGAPPGPFRWPNGLVELPCPVGRVGPFTLPFLGGMYLRYLPPWRLRQAARTCASAAVWAYCHPYDFDTDEPFRPLPGVGLLASLFLWRNRAPTRRRLDLLMRGRRSLPFAARLPALAATAPDFAPA